MTKRIVVLHPDGSEVELEKVPTLKEMQKIVGGWIEHVQVLDRIEDLRFLMTSMFVNEEGRLKNLPRNEKATVHYQRLVRAQHPGEARPFAVHRELVRKEWKAAGIDFIANLEGDDEDPCILGPAIYFEGWTVAEVNAATSSGD